MTIEFACGVVKNNIAIPSMAINNHMSECNNSECLKECKEELEKTKNFQAW